MADKCPKCGRSIPDNSVYCLHCGHGLKSSAKSLQASAGGVLMIGASVSSFIMFVLSLNALLNIYRWYPQLAAGIWIVYDQMLVTFSFIGFLSGLCAALLSLTRKSYGWTVISGMLCTISGGSASILSVIIPHANPLHSLFYYFLPLFATSIIGTILIVPKKEEFDYVSRISDSS